MVSRRGFIRTSSAIPFVSGPFFTGRVFAQGANDLGVGKGADIEAAVRAAVASVGGIEKFVNKGDRVAIKPNLSFASPTERAATTNPATIKAVMKLCLDAGAKQVLVIDHPLQHASIISTKSEVAQTVKDTKDALLILPTTEELYEEKAIPKGIAMKSTKTMKILDEIDVLINLPVAKNHSATFVSLGIKGNLGLVYDRIAYHNCSDFMQSLADLATIITADLTIVDAVRALTTRGPQGPGKVVKLDTIVAGIDPVAVDSYATELTPWNNRPAKGSNILYLKKANEMGLGEIDMSELSINITEV